MVDLSIVFVCLPEGNHLDFHGTTVFSTMRQKHNWTCKGICHGILHGVIIGFPIVGLILMGTTSVSSPPQVAKRGPMSLQVECIPVQG